MGRAARPFVRDAEARAVDSRAARRVCHAPVVVAVAPGETLYVHPSSVLFTRAPPIGTWAVYGDLLHTTQPQMRDLCVVDAAWLLTLAPHYYHRSLH